jgi:hypothetical protein
MEQTDTRLEDKMINMCESEGNWVKSSKKSKGEHIEITLAHEK